MHTGCGMSVMAVMEAEAARHKSMNLFVQQKGSICTLVILKRIFSQKKKTCLPRDHMYHKVSVGILDSLTCDATLPRRAVSRWRR